MHGGQVISIFIFFRSTPSGVFPTHFPCLDFNLVLFVCSPKPNRTKIRLTPKRFLILFFFTTPYLSILLYDILLVNYVFKYSACQSCCIIFSFSIILNNKLSWECHTWRYKLRLAVNDITFFGIMNILLNRYFCLKSYWIF